MAHCPKSPLRCHLVVGTRPEAIKLAPVVLALRADRERFQVRIVTSGQQGEICRSALSAFGLSADVALDLASADRSLAGSAGEAMRAIGRHIVESSPDILFVQGDTTTAMAAALVGFYAKIPVVHVEAGLRSGDLENPFPEEANRKVIDEVSTILLPPTSAAQNNLLRAGFAVWRCPITGNTVVDALQILSKLSTRLPEGAGISEADLRDRKLILVTTHRRESWGADLEATCRAVREIAQRRPDVIIALPVHPNPNVSRPVSKILGNHPRIRLTAPLDYVPFLSLMRRAYLILTDSGGIQEEAPSLGVPVLVLRKTTERPEAAAAGLARIIGTNPAAIVEHTEQLLDDAEAHRLMATAVNPYGDGRAGERIAEVLRNWSSGNPLLPEEHAFRPRPCPRPSSAPAGAFGWQRDNNPHYGEARP